MCRFYFQCSGKDFAFNFLKTEGMVIQMNEPVVLYKTSQFEIRTLTIHDLKIA